MQEVTLTDFKSALDGNNKDSTFIDVRTVAEYNSEHINGVKNIPLDEIQKRLNELTSYQKIYLHCQSGTRCHKAFKQIQEYFTNSSILVFSGGIEAWKQAGYSLERNYRTLPIMRQVMIAAGSLVLVGFISFLLGHSTGLYLMAFVGCGLLFSGLTGWCGIAKFLSFMPWNR